MPTHVLLITAYITRAKPLPEERKCGLCLCRILSVGSRKRLDFVEQIRETFHNATDNFFEQTEEFYSMLCFITFSQNNGGL